MSLPPPVPRTPSTALLWGQFLAAVPLVVVGAVLLCQTIEMLWAARLLERAAMAAVTEATLPAANAASIQAASGRVLFGSDLQDCVERPIIWIDGQPASAAEIGERPSGAAIAVSLSASVTDIVPDWLKPLGMSLAGRRLLAHQIRVKP